MKYKIIDPIMHNGVMAGCGDEIDIAPSTIANFEAHKQRKLAKEIAKREARKVKFKEKKP